MELPLSAPQLSAAAACLAVLLLPLILLFVRSGPGKSAKPVASYSELRTRTVAVNGDLVQTLVPDWYAGRSLYDRQPKEQALGPYGYQVTLVSSRSIVLNGRSMRLVHAESACQQTAHTACVLLLASSCAESCGSLGAWTWRLTPARVPAHGGAYKFTACCMRVP